jgi:hypothetical protein
MVFSLHFGNSMAISNQYAMLESNVGKVTTLLQEIVIIVPKLSKADRNLFSFLLTL